MLVWDHLTDIVIWERSQISFFIHNNISFTMNKNIIYYVIKKHNLLKLNVFSTISL